MRDRQEITEMFSTFVELREDRFSKWLTDIKLRRSMQNCLDVSPNLSREENFWALHWHKHWQQQSNSLAKMHMQAYLQEPCYYVSLKTVNIFRSRQHSLADYFQIANAEIETILKNFNSRRYSSFKAYSIMAIKSRLRDILRQQKEADFYTGWGLLRKVSKKLLVEALDNAGLSTLQISQYRLAWTCFKELYVPNQTVSTKALPEPTPQLWQAIANLYNDSRHQLTQSTSEYTAQTIEKWLNDCIIYLRAYLFPKIQSLNTFKPNSDDNQTVDLPDPSSDLLIADMIAAEDLGDRQNQMSAMVGVLSKALKALDLKSQEVLKLYYQQELTQQQIMEQLQISQPTVSRKLFKGRESLLSALVKWSVEMNISVNPNRIKDMSIALEEWLKNQFGNFNMNP